MNWRPPHLSDKYLFKSKFITYRQTGTQEMTIIAKTDWYKINANVNKISSAPNNKLDLFASGLTPFAFKDILQLVDISVLNKRIAGTMADVIIKTAKENSL